MDLVEMLFNSAMNAESGGGGNLSVATVTVYCRSGFLNGTIPNVDEEYGQITASLLNLMQGAEQTNKVPLYTNGAFVEMNVKEGTTPQIVGDAVYEDGGFVITGDCTIVVEGEGQVG